MRTHDKDGVTREFLKGASRGLREEWMEGNLKGDLISSDAIFVVCSHTFALLIEKDCCVCRNISISFQCVFVCLSIVVSSIFGKGSHFLFPYFV